MALVIILILVVLAYYISEAILTNRAAKNIGIRIHVNGTRGKSSSTKYICSALQAKGIRTYAKITGETPTLILPDGSNEEIKRRSPARISEQFRIIRKAAKNNAEALVLECMSIDPELQKTEAKVLGSNIYIITNIQDDHQEKIGKTAEERNRTFSRVIPPKSILIIPESEISVHMHIAAEKNGNKIVVPEKMEDTLSNSLPDGVFKENIEITAEVIHQLTGHEQKKIIPELLESLRLEKDSSIKYTLAGKPFLNAFPVNDPDSADRFLYDYSRNTDPPEKLVIIFNTRADRPLRTLSFLPWIEKMEQSCNMIILTGDHREYAWRKLSTLKKNNTVSFSLFKFRKADSIISFLKHEIMEQSIILGLGNLKGNGARIVNHVKQEQ